jgi:hypothetical protein
VTKDKEKIWEEIMQGMAELPLPTASTGSRSMKLEITKRFPSGAPREIVFEIPHEDLVTIKAIVDGKARARFDWLRPGTDLLARAKMGDYEPLIRHFERGGELTEKERRVLVKIARGMFPRMGRPPETETEIRNRNIARFAKVLKINGGKRVADVTARKFNIDRSYVPKLLKKYPDEGVSDYLLSAALNGLGADRETTRKIMLASAGIIEDDLREATGRKRRAK